MKFVGRWPRLRGACLIEVHLHEKSFWGNVKWPFKTGARLIQMYASAGGTVYVNACVTVKPLAGFLQCNGRKLEESEGYNCFFIISCVLESK